MLAFFKNLVVAGLLLTGCMSGVGQAAEFSPKQLTGQCLEIYRDWIKQDAPRAFAISGDGQDCGASWSHLTADEARADALNQCTSTGATDCVVVTEDATPPVSVTVGDVVLIRDCATDYENWTEQTAPKSFYATDDGRSCGAAWNYPTLQQASKEARRLCLEYGVACREIGAVE